MLAAEHEQRRRDVGQACLRSVVERRSRRRDDPRHAHAGVVAQQDRPQGDGLAERVDPDPPGMPEPRAVARIDRRPDEDERPDELGATLPERERELAAEGVCDDGGRRRGLETQELREHLGGAFDVERARRPFTLAPTRQVGDEHATPTREHLSERLEIPARDPEPVHEDDGLALPRLTDVQAVPEHLDVTRAKAALRSHAVRHAAD